MKRIPQIFLLIIINFSFAANQLYTYERIDSTLHAWQDEFGDGLHPSAHYSSFGVIYNLDTIGYSSKDNLPIFAVKLSANANIEEAQPRVLIIGQCHAEEIYGVEIAMEIINQFVHPEDYSENRPNLQRGLAYTEIWVIPTINPEGLRVVYGYLDEDGNEIKDVTYRKNKRDVFNYNGHGYGTEGVFDFIPGVGQDIDGVDLNRNYDFNWSFGDTLLVPGASCNAGYDDDYDYYRGLNPSSESEIQSIMDFVKEKNFLLSMAYHSSRSGCIDRYVIYPWAWKDKNGEDQREFSPGFSIIEKLGMEIAEIAGMDIGQNYGHTGSSYRKGNAHDWLYRETGCIQYLVEVGYTPDHDYGDGLLVEVDHMGDVLESNLDAFYHLLMRASGQNKENVLNESVDGNQVNGIVSDAVTNYPIQGAFIKILELEVGNILHPRKTDSLGYYCRLLYPNHEYTMVTSANGYDSDTISIQHSSAEPALANISLIPSNRHNVHFNIQPIENINVNYELIVQGKFMSDTIIVSQAKIINLPEEKYRFTLTATGYVPRVIDIDLFEETFFSIIPLYEKIVVEKNNFNNDELIDGYIMSMTSLNPGDSMVVSMNLKYELEWDNDYFRGYYINLEDSLIIVELTGDNYHEHKEFIPFTIPDDHVDGYLSFHLDLDEKIDYRGVDINNIQVIQGVETLVNSSSLDSEFPIQFHLDQNYPNPFNPITTIKFSVPYFSKISITIYDVRGNLVKKLVNEDYEPGHYVINVNAQDYASGMYFYKLDNGQEIHIKKFMLIK